MSKSSESKKQQLGDYIVGPTLGEGGYAVVRLGTHDKTGDHVALKFFKPERINMKKVEREINAMKSIQHPSVLRLLDYDLDVVYKGKKRVLCVLEFAAGGEIMEYLSFTGVFEEELARTYFHQLMGALSAAHKLKICHRDIKPENLLLNDKFQLKLADFGLSRDITEKDLMTTCGSRGYMAPEMHSDSYDGMLSDVWACGVVLFTMVAGYPPYQELTDGWFKLLQQKRYDRFWKEHARYVSLSDETVDLLTQMLCVDPDNRISVDDIMQHSWYQGDTLDDDTLMKISSQRKKIIDLNRKLKIQEQKSSLSDENEDNVRELGATMIPMVFLPVDEDENEDEGDDDDDDDEIDITDDLQDLDLEKKELEPAPVYSPIKMTFTKFDCSDSAGTVMDGLKESLASLNIEYQEVTDGYEIQCNCTSITNEELTFVINVFTHSEDSNNSVVEFQRRKGSSASYRLVYARVRNKMEHLATKRS